MHSLKGFLAFSLLFLSLLLFLDAVPEAADGSSVFAAESTAFEETKSASTAPVLQNTGAPETFSSKAAAVLTHPLVVPVLLTIAALGLLLEFFTPGVGVPGIIGLISLVLFFYGHFVAGYAGFGSIALVIIGLGLLFTEFLIPGGILGILGIASILVSVFLAGGSLMSTAISIFIALIAATAGMVIIVKFFGKRPQLFKRLILTDATDTESGYVSAVNRPELIGQIAVTATALRPSGTIVLGEERIDAVSEGRFIDPNKQVKIIKVEGSRIVVRELEKQEEE
ncbi:NfeD family protein [Planococcus sp. N064]|uniref:NfeD family protein n=1 Tax=Planococcus liqunii TaxID=3058394 RepID=A0ABT8MPT4_9BACL|nr:NfeD family protein [Planococcus sp. N064]MDN7226880.1 NfeD family protein [Planococcus sp. N064]